MRSREAMRQQSGRGALIVLIAAGDIYILLA